MKTVFSYFYSRHFYFRCNYLSQADAIFNL